MTRIKVRYLIEKPGRDAPRFYWQPTASLRAAGWEPVALKDAAGNFLCAGAAIEAAKKMNVLLN